MVIKGHAVDPAVLGDIVDRDLVDWILAEDAAKAMEGRRGFGTWSEAYLDVLRQLQDNKTLVLNVYRSVGREQVAVSYTHLSARL